MNPSALVQAVFPTPSDADLSNGPCHDTFADTGSTLVRATESTGSHLAAILFAKGVSIAAPIVTPPGTAPDRGRGR